MDMNGDSEGLGRLDPDADEESSDEWLRVVDAAAMLGEDIAKFSQGIQDINFKNGNTILGEKFNSINKTLNETISDIEKNRESSFLGPEMIADYLEVYDKAVNIIFEGYLERMSLEKMRYSAKFEIVGDKFSSEPVLSSDAMLSRAPEVDFDEVGDQINRSGGIEPDFFDESGLDIGDDDNGLGSVDDHREAHENVMNTENQMQSLTREMRTGFQHVYTGIQTLVRRLDNVDQSMSAIQKSLNDKAGKDDVRAVEHEMHKKPNQGTILAYMGILVAAIIGVFAVIIPIVIWSL